MYAISGSLRLKLHLQPPLSTDRYPELNPTEALDLMNVWGL